ncbi:MAG: class II aldolase/adducin family protein [Rhodovibrionaceae bacterium]
MSERLNRAEAIEQLVIANRILAHEGVIDVFGHVSLRHPEDPERFLLSCGRSPSLVTRDDIMEFDLDGRETSDSGLRPYAERFIHAAVYKTRPDVGGVSHHHAKAILPFTASEMPLRPVNHTGAVIGAEVPRWDSQEAFGDTNMLVASPPMGAAVAEALGEGRCLLLRGHGAVCAAESVMAVVFVSVYMKENAEVQLATHALGEIAYLRPGEIELADKLQMSPMPMRRAWEYWKARAGYPG